MTPEQRDASIPQEAIDRLWAAVEQRGPDECWPWRGRAPGSGYGQIAVNGKQMGAHRLALIVTSGPPPSPGLLTLHSCDNPPCCNPRHLSWGTVKQNALESSERSRHHHGQKTFCPQGHAYTVENTYWRHGTRECRVCKNARATSLHRKARERGDLPYPMRKTPEEIAVARAAGWAKRRALYGENGRQDTEDRL